MGAAPKNVKEKYRNWGKSNLHFFPKTPRFLYFFFTLLGANRLHKSGRDQRVISVDTLYIHDLASRDSFVTVITKIESLYF